MTVQNRRTRVLASVLAVVVLTTFAAAGRAENVAIKMATLVPSGSAWHTTLLELVQKWQQLSGGKVTLRLYPGGVAGDDSDVVRKLRLGTLDAGLLTSAGLADIDRSVFAISIPMAYADYDELNYVWEKLSPELERIYADKGFVVLGWADAGWVRFFAKSPVKTPDDLKALKLFNWAGDPQAVETWKAAGFNPVPLPSTEISTALQTGLVTALPTTSQAALLLQWYTHAKYMTDINWAVLAGAIVVTQKSWDKVPADLQPALREAAREAGRKLRVQTREAAAGDIPAMTAHGLTVVQPDAAALAAWRKVAETAYPKARGSFVPAGIFDSALRLRDEYRAAHPGKAGR
jgi:TRAP-type transport system periplasmic protein